MSDSTESITTIKTKDLFDVPWEDVLVPYLGGILSVKDCFNLRCVSKSAKQLSDAILRKTHKLVLYSTLAENNETVEVLRKNCQDVRILTVPNSKIGNPYRKILPDKFMLLTSGLKGLRYVNLANCVNLNPKSVHHIFVNSKHLTFLDLTRCCWLTDGALQTLIVHQKHLRNINLRCCCQLSTKCLIQLVALCPNVESLSLEQVSSADDTVLSAILHHSRNLKCLNLLMCRDISPRAIERFLLMRPGVKIKQYGCRSLVSLHPANFALVHRPTGEINLQMPLGLGFF